MTKDYRKMLRIDENINSYLEQKENVSEYIRELILKDMNEQTSLLLEKNRLQQEEQKLKNKLIDIQLQIQHVDHQITELELKSTLRCDGYEEAVDILESLPMVNISDVEFQAKQLGVDQALFKQWLFDDKFFEKHLQ